MHEQLHCSSDFCQYLLDRGVLEAEDAQRVRNQAKNERMQIGQILVMRGDLSVRQVMNLLELQTDFPGVRFGELALKAGYLTTVQLADALKLQATQRRHQIEVLVQEGLVERRSLDSALVGYVLLLEMQADSHIDA